MTTARDEEFGHYVVERRTTLLRTATLLTAGDRHLAEDLVQTCLTRLYVAWPAFRRAANPHGYAHRTLVNALMDEHRRPWRRHELPLPDLPERRAAGEDGPSTADDLHAALRTLPPRMRAALVCRFFLDQSVAQTAEILGCREGTVKSQTARALDHLRTALGDVAIPPPDQPVGHRATTHLPVDPATPLSHRSTS